MKNFYISLIFILFITSFNSIHAQCPNGDLEMNNFSNWKGYTGYYASTRYRINRLKEGFLSGRHEIVDGFPFDEFGDFETRSEGQYALKLGSKTVSTSYQGYSQMASYTFTVTEQNKHFKFQYALVLKDGNHRQNAFFKYYITVNNKRTPNVFSTKERKLNKLSEKEIIADKKDPFFKKSNNGFVIYKDWTCEKIDLSAYVGQTLTIHFISSECKGKGHFGYAYIDALCKENESRPNFEIAETICKNANIIMDANDSENEDSYYVSIQESDASWTRIGAEVSQWFVAKKAGNIDLKKIMSDKNKEFKCNTYYRVKLATVNKCSGWKETTKLIYVSCPDIDLGEDDFLCCKPEGGSINVLTIKPNENENGNFTYTNASASNGEYVNFYAPGRYFVTPYPQETTTYTITATNEIGCSSTNTKTIHIKKPFYVEIEENLSNICVGEKNCSHKLIANIYEKNNCQSENYTLSNNTSNYQYLWDTQESTKQIEIKKEGLSFYEVKVSNGCEEQTNFIRGISKNEDDFTGGFPILHSLELIFFGPNDDMVIRDVTKAENEVGAYNATKYTLFIMSAWTENIVMKIEGCNPNGFKNGEIRWDGKDKNGQYVPTGAYYYEIKLYNCSNPNGQLITTHRYVRTIKDGCEKFVTILWKRFCIRAKWTSVYQDIYESSGKRHFFIEY